VAQADLRQDFVSDAAVFYVENCAVCHGAAGEGIGPTPALDNPGLREADYDFLYKTIARGRYDTTMSGWHEDEGGIYNEYQVDELVALVRYADWSQVGELAAAQGLIGSKASHLIQATAILTFLVSSYIVVLNFPNPIAIKDHLRRD